jgi:hypothetical protein
MVRLQNGKNSGERTRKHRYVQQRAAEKTLRLTRVHASGLATGWAPCFKQTGHLFGHLHEAIQEHDQPCTGLEDGLFFSVLSF